MDILVSGTIIQALGIQQGVSQRTGNTWQRATYVIEHEHGQYPKKLVFDVTGNKIQELNIQPGENVTLHLNCDAHEYNGRLFNSIEAWKVDRPQVQQGYAQQPMQQAPAQNPFPPQGQQMVQQQQVQQAPVQNPFPQQPMQQQVQQPAPGAAPFPPQMQGQQPIQGTQQMPQQQAAPQGQSQQLPF